MKPTQNCLKSDIKPFQNRYLPNPTSTNYEISNIRQRDGIVSRMKSFLFVYETKLAVYVHSSALLATVPSHSYLLGEFFIGPRL